MMLQPIRCVYETLLLPTSVRCWLMMRRFSSITLTGMVRCEVASGTEALAAMFCAMRAAAPLRGTSSPAGSGAGAAVAGAAPAGTGAGAAGAGAPSTETILSQHGTKAEGAPAPAAPAPVPAGAAPATAAPAPAPAGGSCP